MNTTPSSGPTQARSNSLPVINADTVLAAARQHARYLRAAPPRDYEMRVFADGSVFLRNTENPRLCRLLTLADIQSRTADFRLDPQRVLWQHIVALWA